MTTSPVFPRVRQVVFDSEDARTLAELHRHLLGPEYRAGDEPPPLATSQSTHP
jgi:hypothetical protein